MTSLWLTWDTPPNNQLLQTFLTHYSFHSSIDKGWETPFISGQFLQTWVFVYSKTDSTSDCSSWGRDIKHCLQFQTWKCDGYVNDSHGHLSKLLYFTQFWYQNIFCKSILNCVSVSLSPVYLYASAYIYTSPPSQLCVACLWWTHCLWATWLSHTPGGGGGKADTGGGSKAATGGGSKADTSGGGKGHS